MSAAELAASVAAGVIVFGVWLAVCVAVLRHGRPEDKSDGA